MSDGDWRSRFIAAGVPPSFISIIETSRSRRDDLGSSFGSATKPGTRFDDARLESTAWLLYASSNNDSFVVLLERASRFVRFGKEEGVLHDYGPHAALVLADLVIDLFENLETPVDELRNLCVEIGLEHGDRLVDALETADRSTFEKDGAWRLSELPRLLGVT